MTLNLNYDFPAGAPNDGLRWKLAYASDIERVFALDSDGYLFNWSPETLYWSDDAGVYTLSGASQQEWSVLFYRPGSLEGNTYGALYLLPMDSSSTNSDLMVRGEIIDSIGENVTWTTISDTSGFPYSLGDSSTAAYDLLNDKLWVIEEASNQLRSYDIATDTWISSYSTLSIAVSDPAMVVANNKIYLISAQQSNSKFYSYDIDTDTWLDLSSDFTAIQDYSYAFRELHSIKGHLVFVNSTDTGEASNTYTYDFVSPWQVEAMSTPAQPGYTHYSAAAAYEQGGQTAIFMLEQTVSKGAGAKGVSPVRHMMSSGVLVGDIGMSRPAVLDVHWRILRPAVLKSKHQNETKGVFSGLSKKERNGVLDSFSENRMTRRGVLRSGFNQNFTRNSALIGNHDIHRSGKLFSKWHILARGIFYTDPKVYPTAELRADRIKNYTCKAIEGENNVPLFFNELTIKFNKDITSDKFSSSITLRSLGSQNYYKEIIPYEIELDLIHTFSTAIEIGKDYLLQHHIVPLIITCDYEDSLENLDTMDFVEINYPIGISADGQWNKTTCRVREIRWSQVLNRTTLSLFTNDYVYFAPGVTTVQVSNTGILTRVTSDRVEAVRTFTFVEESAGNLPIQGAKVTVAETGDSNITDQYGNVSFTLLPGIYHLTVTSGSHHSGSFVVPIA